MTTTKAEKEEAKAELLKRVKPGATVYTILRHVSRSGMRREIDCFVLDRNGGRPVYLSGHAATLLGYRRSLNKEHFALIVDGCGMDMGFHVVYELSCILFGKSGGCGGAKALHQEWL